jgi:2-deoxy-D-gluconate 3-dehydrogenase
MAHDQNQALSALFDLSGSTAIVTGGGQGIGRAIAENLGRAGAAVVVADADLEVAQATVQELSAAYGVAMLAVQTDVSSPSSVEHLVAETVTWKGGIDILVNNAGIYPAVPVLQMSADLFDRVIAVNLRGVFLCSQLVARQMIAQGHGGRIINVTSVDALHPSSVGLAHYDASKHGAWGFTKNLALELAPHGIWVNAIAPGGIATPGASHMEPGPGVDPEELISQFLAKIPMGRMGDADEIGTVALFLASPMASYMTGSQVVVDGGVLLS